MTGPRMQRVSKRVERMQVGSGRKAETPDQRRARLTLMAMEARNRLDALSTDRGGQRR